jgi:hypothetical protein
MPTGPTTSEKASSLLPDGEGTIVARYRAIEKGLLAGLPAVIVTQTDADLVGDLRAEAGRVIKEIEEYHSPRKKRAYEIWKDWCSQEAALIDPLKRFMEAARQLVVSWVDAERKQRQQIENEKAALAKKQAEDAAVAQATTLQRFGRKAEAEQVIAEAAATPAPMPSEAAPVQVSGVKVKEVWKWRFTNTKLVNPSFLIPDEAAITKAVAGLRERAAEVVGGIEVYKQTTVDNRGGRR